ncbi:MAG: endonuclease/exonuclease/phosphatase family protein [Clostridia bacterium]|nr:endonuclease/exonuclease/phosphatase family protein [Clostridia bacterium]
MRKKLRFLSLALALILLASALFGCNKPTDTETQPEAKTSILTINGVALEDFTVVFDKRPISGAEKAFAYLNEKLEVLYGTALNGVMSSKDRYEILIGLDGDDEAIAQAYAENPSGLIGATEKKIVLLGANYTALCQVIDAFLDKATGETGSKEISVSGYECLDLNKASINVMSYNVLSDLGKEGRPSDPRTKMVDTILENDTDVFGTQEDGQANAAAFTQKLKSYSIYKGGDISDNSNYIYWKTDKFNLKEKGCYYLSDTPEIKSKYNGSNHYRTMAYVILEVKETGKQFVFVDVHADYRAEEPVRVKQLTALTNIIKNINKNNLPIVIVGDFNTTPTTSGGAIPSFLRENPNFSRTEDIAHTEGDTGGTLVDGFIKRDNKYVFDHIFVSTDKIFTRYYTVVDNIKNGKYPSDHVPVLSKIDIY